MKRKMMDNEGVSPIVGVMLMLVVCIIIAAVVSGYAGGLVNGKESSPTLSMDVKVSNTGSYIGSGFSANVISVSQPIESSNLKLVTSWATTMKINTSADLSSTQQGIPNGNIFTGGNTSIPGKVNVWCWQGMQTKTITNWSTAPFAVGPGITNTNAMDAIGNQSSGSAASRSSSWFGQYTLQPGVALFAYPYGSDSGTAIAGAPGLNSTGGYNGATKYSYASDSANYVQGQIDPTAAILGGGWEQLRAGDSVNVKLIYTPTGAAIFSKDVVVSEG